MILMKEIQCYLKFHYLTPIKFVYRAKIYIRTVAWLLWECFYFICELFSMFYMLNIQKRTSFFLEFSIFCNFEWMKSNLFLKYNLTETVQCLKTYKQHDKVPDMLNQSLRSIRKSAKSKRQEKTILTDLSQSFDSGRRLKFTRGNTYQVLVLISFMA